MRNSDKNKNHHSHIKQMDDLAPQLKKQAERREIS
jgi:hypothetical protein